MSSSPLIGLTGRRTPGVEITSFPKPLQPCETDVFIVDYATAVAEAGGLPVYLSPVGDAAAVVDRLDGLVLGGGADVNPARYGAEVEEKCGPIEDERDEFEFALYEAAVDAELPVLGICRGLQVINVAQGGTLHQHVRGHTTRGTDNGGPHHKVELVEGTQLAGLFGEAALAVNSLHHQAADVIGDDLTVTATSDDGIVEGLEHQSLPVMSVQWHPELQTSADREPLLTWLITTVSSAQ